MGRKWFWGIIILAIISLLLAIIGPWSAPARSEQMQASIEKALSSDKFDFVDVEMQGNVATLSGEAPSKALMTEAVSIAQHTEVESGKQEGHIWHEIVNAMTVNTPPPAPTQPQEPALQTVSPFIFTASKAENGNVILNGYVRNKAELSRILQEAQSLFGDSLSNNSVNIAAGAPDNSWGDVISLHLPELAKLETGTFSLENGQALINGVTTDTGLRSNINTLVSDLNSRYGLYTGAANIRVPNATAENAGEVKSENICQTLFNDLKKNTRINFSMGKAEIIGADSFELLNNLASAVNQCKTFQVRVEGYTDTTGEEAFNDWLSQQRARSVVAYLADAGVEINRLTATGHGSDNPIASNDTPEGRAQNRRIEFKVTKSE